MVRVAILFVGTILAWGKACQSIEIRLDQLLVLLNLGGELQVLFGLLAVLFGTSLFLPEEVVDHVESLLVVNVEARVLILNRHVLGVLLFNGLALLLAISLHLHEAEASTAKSIEVCIVGILPFVLQSVCWIFFCLAFE